MMVSGRNIVCFVFLSGLLWSQNAVAQSLSFKPQRVVLDGRGNSAVLTLTNSGRQIESYRIELIDIIYKSDGSIVDVANPPAGFPSAKSYVRFSPNQVRLKAGESQNIRILVRGNNKLSDGEYRVHARFRKLPNVTNLVPKAAPKKVIAGTVGMDQAVAIPIILRRGATSATGSIAKVAVIKRGSSAALDLVLRRSGNRSLYLDMALKNRSGKVDHQIKGIAVPVPNSTRRVIFSIDGLSEAKLRGGGYTLEMIDHDTRKVVDSKRIP